MAAVAASHMAMDKIEHSAELKLLLMQLNRHRLRLWFSYCCYLCSCSGYDSCSVYDSCSGYDSRSGSACGLCTCNSCSNISM